MVVPTSTICACEKSMMSGMRNDPPISMSSPREMTACLPEANSCSTIITAAALLFTAMAASAPVSEQMSPSQWLCLLPRCMEFRSYSRVE